MFKFAQVGEAGEYDTNYRCIDCGEHISESLDAPSRLDQHDCSAPSIADAARKFIGAYPYETFSNPCVGDAWFYQEKVKFYGKDRWDKAVNITRKQWTSYIEQFEEDLSEL